MPRILQTSVSPLAREARILEFEELPSTNSWAMEHLPELRHGDVVRALRQTAGRGRLERKWCSGTQGSLTFSIILRDARLLTLGPNLGQLAACAVLRTLGENGVEAKLKWPNDVLVCDSKICGILVEQAGGGGDFVVGIGLNVNLSGPDMEAFALDRPATSLQCETGKKCDEGRILVALLEEYERQVAAALTDGLGGMLAVWAGHDWLAGREVKVLGSGQVLEGRCLGLDDGGRMRLRLGSGVEECCWTGDVERVIAG